MWYFAKPKDNLWFLFTLGTLPDREVSTSLGNKSCAKPHCVPNQVVYVGSELSTLGSPGLLADTLTKRRLICTLYLQDDRTAIQIA
jgi:hypothetical protein